VADQDPDVDQTPDTSVATVEEVVRGHLAKALGGRRGMLEAAVPTAVFTVGFLVSHDLLLSVLVAVGCATVLLVVRVGQRTTTQFVINSLFGIGVGALFAWRAARGGGDANDQALAYFLPGILYNLGYSVVMVFTILIRWPIVGFMVGSVTGDPTAWHEDRGTVRLCSRLTWLLVLPCVVRVVVQGPVYLAGRNDWWDRDSAVALLGVAKLAMGWPLQIAALAAMVWLLSRNKTPVAGE
jgi:hypothetical protein